MRLKILVLVCFCAGITGILLSDYQNVKSASKSSTGAISDQAIAVSTSEPTTFFDNGGPFIEFPLTCPKDMTLRDGLSWRGVTIGYSPLSDVEDVYGVLGYRVDPIEPGSFAPSYGIDLTVKAARERKLPGSMETCIVDGRVAVLALSGDNDDTAPPSVPYWIQRFGIPDIVTWSYMDWSYRDLLWSKVGLALEVRIDTTDLAHHPDQVYAEIIVFFPPSKNAGDLSSWPYSGLHKIAPTVPNDKGISTDENPFNFDAMVGTV